MTSVLMHKWGLKVETSGILFHTARSSSPSNVWMLTSSSGCSLGGAGLCSYCTKQTLKVPHAYMSPARQLFCMTVLLSQPHITIEHCVTFNPATLLLMAEDGNPKDCVEKTDKNYGNQSWPTRYAFSKSWFNYCLLMVQANEPWTRSHYFHTIPHRQRN